MVKLEHIEKTYGMGVPVLTDVSLELEPGGFYFLTGASGVGKTTLLNLICLAEQPTRGKLTLFGRDPTRLNRSERSAFRRRIGIVFQDFRLIDDLSAFENVALPLRIKGAAEKQIRDNVPELLAWVGLDSRSEAPASTLSGGEQQRIAIARAVVARPDLLVADEPTGNVDDDVAMLLVRVFERINRLGTTVLIATHDIAFARQFAHRRFHLERGRVSLVWDDSATQANIGADRIESDLLLRETPAAFEVETGAVRTSPDEMAEADGAAAAQTDYREAEAAREGRAKG